MKTETLSVDEVRRHLDETKNRITALEAEITETRVEFKFWDDLLPKVIEARRRIEGHPSRPVRVARDTPSRQERRLYEGSVAFHIVRFLNNAVHPVDDDEILEGLLDEGWESGKSQPDAAVHRGLQSLLKRGYVVMGVDSYFKATDDGLIAARIKNGGTPHVGGSGSVRKEESHEPALAN